MATARPRRPADPTPTGEPAKTLEVVATARGYHGQLREVGDRFRIPAGEPLGNWMQPAAVQGASQAQQDET